MPEAPSYEELKQRVSMLESQIELLKQSEKELLEYVRKKDKESEGCGSEEDDTRFVPLDEEDEYFNMAEKKIEILEAYEYYLSQTFPIMITLTNAINEYPMLEPIMEKLVMDILSVIDVTQKKQDIIKHAIDFLRLELNEK